MALVYTCEGTTTYNIEGSVLCDTWVEHEYIAPLPAPQTIEEHVELAWLVVIVLLAGAAVKFIRKTL